MNAEPKTHRRPAGTGFWISLGLALLTLAVLLLIGVRLAQQPVTYDGAMNLQVSERLASEGDYVRPFAGERPFPHEIQTNAPYVVVGALVFGAFGVGMFTAQLPNLIYLVGLCALAGGTAQGFYRPGPWPWLGALAVLATPGLIAYGMNGYGEIPGLFWWFAGTAGLFLGAQASLPRILAGTCLGLAFLTKTVMLLPIACALAAWGLWQLVAARLNPLEVIRPGLALVIGLLLPVAAFEAWRFLGLGGVEGYTAWWAFQLEQIGMQAGVAPGFVDTPDRMEKLRTHFGLLAGFLGLPIPLAAAWLLLPVSLALFTLPRLSGAQRGFVVALVLMVAAYFAWWLLLTPTEKAWHRRILNGMVIVQILWVHAAWWLWFRFARWRPVQLVGASALALVLGHGLVLRVAERPASEALDPYFAGLERIRALPEDALVLGQGWHSAPKVELYSGRRLQDLNALPLAGLEGTVYAVRDAPGRSAGALTELLAVYPSETLVQEPGIELYAIDTTERRPWLLEYDEALVAGVDRVVTAEGFYPVSRGITRDRWAMTLAELILEAQGPVVGVRVGTWTPPSPYVLGEDLSLRVVIDGCDLGRQPLNRGSGRSNEYALPSDCRIEAGDRVRIGLESDNMLALPYPQDPRQLSYILTEVALVYGEPVDAPAEGATGAGPETPPSDSVQRVSRKESS